MVIEEVSFNYDLETDRYTNVSLVIKNFDSSSPHYGSITVVLYDNLNTEIATGIGATGTISPGVRQGGIYLTFTWTGVYTSVDFSRGRLTLIQLG